MTDTDNMLNSNLLIIHTSFPRIGKALELYWGNKEFHPYMNSLLSDTRNSRQGFPSHILFALIELQQLHDKVFPALIVDDPDDWKSSQFGIV